MASLNEQGSKERLDKPRLHPKEMNCIFCGEKMFYSEDNFVHVCLAGDHGILAYFEPDSCWFAAEETTVAKLKQKGVKHHYIPKHVFENGGIGENFECDNKDQEKS
jgi:hypothetical protein